MCAKTSIVLEDQQRQRCKGGPYLVQIDVDTEQVIASISSYHNYAIAAAD